MARTALMMSAILVFGVAAALLPAAALGCSITSTTPYTTVDASILTSIAYVALLETSGCPTENLYAQVTPSGQLIQLSRSPLTPSTLQLSWTEDTAKATKGDHKINIISEESYNQVRKAIKAGGSASAAATNVLATANLNHPGAYNGPWLNSEHLAAILGIGVTYIAVSQRAKLIVA